MGNLKNKMNNGIKHKWSRLTDTENKLVAISGEREEQRGKKVGGKKDIYVIIWDDMCETLENCKALKLLKIIQYKAI